MKLNLNFGGPKEAQLHKQIRKWLTEQGLTRGQTFFMTKPRSGSYTGANSRVNFTVSLDDENVATMLQIAFSEYARK